MRRVYVLLALGAISLAAAVRMRGQERPQPSNSLPESTKKVGNGTVRVCLRLDDGMPFLGEADVRLKASEGAGGSRPASDTMGDYQFLEPTPGKYVVEVSAPGFLPQQLSTEVEAGGGQRTLFIVMNRRVVGSEEGKAAEPKAGEETEKAAADAARAEPKAEPAKESAKANREAPKAAPAPGGRDFWRDRELEQVVPSVESGVACPLERVLAGTGRQMSDFVDTLEKFTATEEVEHFPVRKSGELDAPEKRQFSYVVTVTQNLLGTFLLDEFRNGSNSTEMFPGHVATRGLPALALIFHPLLEADFEFKCEGMGQRGGREVWQMHFAQRSDHPVRIREYNVNGNVYPVSLEGRAWIDPGSFQVVRLETELEKPIPQIQLTKEHMTIDYAPVRFAQSGQEIWLPQRAELYVERHERRYYRRHSYSDFKLFNVETAQAVQAPRGSYSFTNLTDRDVRGELTVMSKVAGTAGQVITLRFTVPARGRVIKTVGVGKDVNVAGTSVVAARFVYAGEEGAMRVDANLVKESTLDVVPAATLGVKP